MKLVRHQYRQLIRNLSLLLLLVALPAIAACGGLSKPEKNFEQFWKIFNQHYTSFELRGVDWQQQYETYRPKVTPNTSNKELFTVFTEMVRPLRDGHVTLSSNNDYFSSGDGTLYVDREFRGNGIDQIFKLSEKTLKQAGFGKVKKRGSLFRYAKSGNLGYLRVRELEGESDKDVRKQLDKILKDFKDLSGVIIDIRSNPGGEDKTAFAIANRFADSRRLAHTKITQKSPGQFSDPKEFYLEPYKKGTFDGPVVLLTNDASASAADVMALIMKQIPNVTIVGDRTEGIFSDMMNASLPNGWDITLSNQRYFSPQGINYEVVGVPVDIELKNTAADLKSESDPVINKALELLSSS